MSLAVASFRAFRDKTGTMPLQWQRIRRSPVRRRMRRVLARNIRPLRNHLAIRADPRSALALDREARHLQVDLSVVRKYARAAGGGIGDLTAAVLAAALIRLEPDRASVGVLVPVSGRVRGDDSAGNQVKVTRVVLPASDDVPTLTSAVADQVSDAVKENRFPPVPPGSWDAYATFLPGPPRSLVVLGRKVESVIPWTPMDPREGYAVLASSCGPNLEFALMVGHGVDADVLLEEMRQVLIEEDLIGRVEVPA
jgi:hypothetical protein